jgi:steroid delta-isomerase-like uncharacterized protein
MGGFKMEKYKLSFVFIALFVLAAVGCDMTSKAKLEANKEIVRQFTDALNNKDFDLLDDLALPDFVRHCQATPDIQVRSLDEFKELQKQFLITFPDQRITNEIMIAEGDYIATYSNYTGTQEGPMGAFPASGKKVEFAFMGIFHFKEGKIAEIWVEWDNISVLTQLGHFPPPK